MGGLEGSRPEIYFSDPDVQTVLIETFAALSSAFGSTAVLWQLRLRMRFAMWRSFVSQLMRGMEPLASFLGRCCASKRAFCPSDPRCGHEA